MKGSVIGVAWATLLSCVVAVGTAGAQVASTPTTTPAPAQTTATPPTTMPAPTGRVFGADAGIIFNQIKPDKTAEFESVMARLKEALQKSTDPVRRQQATGWRVYRSVEPGPNGSVLYLFLMNPAVKGADYTVSKILSDSFPTEAQALYKQFSEAYAGGQSLVNLQLVQNFAPVAAPGAGQDHQ